MNLLESKTKEITIDAADWDEEQWNQLEALFDIVVTDATELVDMGIVPEDVFGDPDDEDITPFEGEEKIYNWIEQVGKVIATVEDDYGWDQIFLMPNGKVISPDRNSGSFCVAHDAKTVLHGLKEFY